MKKRSWASVVLAGVVMVALSMNARALQITPDDDGWLVLWGYEASNASVVQSIAEYLSGLGCDALEVYKAEVDDGDEYGSYAPFYMTTFDNEPDDPQDALIRWTGPEFIHSDCVYLLVKGGVVGNPAWYFFDLSLAGWNGKDDLELLGFWPGRGAISHVALYANPNGVVPDGGSAALMLGFGLLALGGVRRLVG